ncbi:hypothetical protein GCM10025867_46000 (plasmid) [Frondihabitans sucicola]|uniref:Uncharacterized protein n=1 Tax=Frondihabitans sucicola TaxID=1268041 RepID=A0ABM8GV59_9MICO|nr:hypothetical protein [Frondihabitans sucicola]BDZ52359.1 hypothetical protein GCM10025867_46000 [Frondihabitans sucicola]
MHAIAAATLGVAAPTGHGSLSLAWIGVAAMVVSIAALALHIGSRSRRQNLFSGLAVVGVAFFTLSVMSFFTAIFVGLGSTADAIRSGWGVSQGEAEALGQATAKDPAVAHIDGKAIVAYSSAQDGYIYLISNGELIAPKSAKQ